MLARIDADILVYRCGFVTENESVTIACHTIDEMVSEILENTKADSYSLYLTKSNDATAYRKEAYPIYKQHRVAPKPKHYLALREHLVNKYQAIISETIEADDAISIDSHSDLRTALVSVVVSIDKDLNQIPGRHYNFVKKLHYDVSEWDGIKYFYKQLLTGDTADNVKGVAGIGDKKSERLLSECFTESDLFSVVRSVYNDDEEMLRNAEALWILRSPYPQGRWCFSQYGGKLAQEIIAKCSLDGSPLPHGLECIVPQMDGCCTSGTGQMGKQDCSDFQTHL